MQANKIVRLKMNLLTPFYRRNAKKEKKKGKKNVKKLQETDFYLIVIQVEKKNRKM